MTFEYQDTENPNLHHMILAGFSRLSEIGNKHGVEAEGRIIVAEGWYSQNDWQNTIKTLDCMKDHFHSRLNFTGREEDVDAFVLSGYIIDNVKKMVAGFAPEPGFSHVIAPKKPVQAAMPLPVQEPEEKGSRGDTLLKWSAAALGMTSAVFCATTLTSVSAAALLAPGSPNMETFWKIGAAAIAGSGLTGTALDLCRGANSTVRPLLSHLWNRLTYCDNDF
jgi:hypothetical protein